MRSIEVEVERGSITTQMRLVRARSSRYRSFDRRFGIGSFGPTPTARPGAKQGLVDRNRPRIVGSIVKRRLLAPFSCAGRLASPRPFCAQQTHTATRVSAHWSYLCTWVGRSADVLHRPLLAARPPFHCAFDPLPSHSTQPGRSLGWLLDRFGSDWAKRRPIAAHEWENKSITHALVSHNNAH